MYITPNSTIHILKNVPLSRNYENTVYYKTAAEQQSGFLGFQKFSLSNYSYQRQTIGIIRVQLSYESLYDCNYLMFQNTAFGLKWFYAFIDGVSYINNSVSEIYYTIDVLQTWCYDYQFLPSFVERRHSSTDALYENTQPEGLELGYASDKVLLKTIEFPTYTAFLMSQQLSTVPSGVTMLGIGQGSEKYFMGLTTYFSEGTTGATAMVNEINSEGLADAVVAVFSTPYAGLSHSEDFYLDFPSALANEYTPKNKKLLSFPFRRLLITNNCGISQDYKYERSGEADIERGSMIFRLQYTGTPLGEARIYPVGYYDMGSDIDFSVVYGAFPATAIATDTFAAWWAQNKNNYLATINAIGTSFDTNQAIAQNNFNQANRNATNANVITTNSINAGLAQAQGNLDASMENYRRQAGYNYAQQQRNTPANLGNIIGGVSSSVQQLINDENTANTAAAQMASSTIGAAAQSKNASLALSNALQNAATNYTNSQLSMLTSRNNAIAQMMAKKQDLQNVPNAAKGNAQAETLNYILAGNNFSIYNISITEEYAERIDKYFTAYGYAQNRLYSSEELNTRINRPHFTYTKTTGAHIKGALNAQDAAAIEAIYDNGVTTWDSLEDVGDYSLDNTPA